MFTKEYIEMVINNKQIQSLCKYNKGDWFWNGEKPYLYCKSGLGSSNPHDYKWLPTLEDLFGILYKHYPVDIYDTIWEFNDWLSDNYYKGYKWIKEGLLEFVMEKIYNKSWNPNNKEWEAIN